ncbi:MAG TPA: hypothetical protein VGV89_06750 [Thermoplasmata archaeon]|nr:hypothetical protein [Thermoplasmata archaeon]
MEERAKVSRHWERKQMLARAGLVGSLGAILVVLSMTLSGAAAVAPPSVTVKAPYHGAVQPGAYTGISGCGHAGYVKTPNFNLKTGTGGMGVGTASAKACGPGVDQIGSYNEGYLDPSLEMAITTILPTGSHSVATNWKLAWNTSGSYLVTKPCPAPKSFVQEYSYTSPSYAYWDNYTGKEAICYAEAEFFIDLESAYIQDLTAGGQTYSNSCPSSYCFVQLNSSNAYRENDSGWEFYSYVTWNGTAYTRTHGVFSQNYTFSTAPSFSGSASKLWTMYFNGTFNRAHKYAIVVDFYGFAYADVSGYGAATAKVAVNTQTLGNGLSLSSIVTT